MRMLILLMIPLCLLCSCCRYIIPSGPCPEGKYLFLDAPAKCVDEYASWIEVPCGPAILNCTTATLGVYSLGLDALNSDLGNLTICGKAWLRKSMVRGESHIEKNASFCDSQVWGDSYVGGDVWAYNSFFLRDLTICGDLTAKCSQFSGCISTAAECVTLSQVEAERIYFHPAGEFPDRQVIKLKHGTSVGSIEFASGRGCVIMDCSSRCGVVCGGTVVEPYPSFDSCWGECE